MVRLADRLDMTIVVDWDVKQKQTEQHHRTWLESKTQERQFLITTLSQN